MDMLIREVATYIMVEIAVCTFVICTVFMICYGYGGRDG